MTALCGGGTSGPKPGQEAALIYSSGLLVQVLEELSLGWLTPLIPLVPLAPFVLSTFCASDPPTVVQLTSPEANALLQVDLTNPAFTSGASKLPAIFEAAIWNYSCQCTSGTYTPPTVTQPAGTTVVVNPQPGTATACGSFPIAPDGTPAPYSRTFGPNSSNVAIYTGGNPFTGKIPSAAHIDWLFINNPGPAPALTLTWRFTGTTGVAELDIPISFPAGTLEFHIDQAWPGAQYVGVSVRVDFGSTGGIIKGNSTLSIYCDGQFPGSQQPCCPPDSATQGYLDSILKLVTLIQRQQVPFAYVAGATHSALSGNGSLAIQGLLGVKILPTSIPNDAGIEVGDPDTYWLDSWINWGNADGWTTREFLRASPHISMPALAGQFTQLGYSLRPGLTVSITELVREA